MDDGGSDWPGSDESGEDCVRENRLDMKCLFIF